MSLRDELQAAISDAYDKLQYEEDSSISELASSLESWLEQKLARRELDELRSDYAKVRTALQRMAKHLQTVEQTTCGPKVYDRYEWAEKILDETQEASERRHHRPDAL